MFQLIFALLGAVVFCMFYFATRLLRTVFAWGNRDEGPRERIGFYLAIFAFMGAAAGWMAYEPFILAQQCKAAGQPVIPCTFFPH